VSSHAIGKLHCSLSFTFHNVCYIPPFFLEVMSNQVLNPYHTVVTLVKHFVIHRLPSQPPVHFHRVKSPIVLAANTPSRRKSMGCYHHQLANSPSHHIKVARHPIQLVIPSAAKFRRFTDMNAPPSATWDLVHLVVFHDKAVSMRSHDEGDQMCRFYHWMVRRNCCAIGRVQSSVHTASTNVGGFAARLLRSHLEKEKKLELRVRMRIRLGLEKRRGDARVRSALWEDADLW
jgi:hypothetical protein